MMNKTREIKFRAWDGKRMFDVDVLAISPCAWDCPDPGRHGVSIAYQPHIKIMQYTGLEDKYGTEIYEGDIIHDSDWECIGSVSWSDKHLAWVVKIDRDYEFLSEFVDEKTGVTASAKVIGNIHDNPELLEVK